MAIERTFYPETDEQVVIAVDVSTHDVEVNDNWTGKTFVIVRPKMVLADDYQGALRHAQE